MDGLHITVVILLGFSSSSYGQTFVSEKEVTANPGDNVTLHCDCKLSTGVLTVWFRNCSHENQPTFVLEYDKTNFDYLFPSRFDFVKNFSSNSYDLLITNVSHSDEGIYYCGNHQIKVEQKEKITRKNTYTFSNKTTRLTIKPSRLHVDVNKTQQHCDVDHRDVDWKLLFFPCLSVAFVSSLLSSLLKSSSSSYDLLITNVTDSDKSYYYCRTNKKKEGKNGKRDRYSNVTTRLTIRVFSSSFGQTFVSEKEVTANPGDNVTLHCDCKLSTGVLTVWFRNCSHENQPTFVLRPGFHEINNFNYRLFPSRFDFVKNLSSNSYDLLITNVSHSDEGIYYCGNSQMKVEQKEKITGKNTYTFSNKTTRLTISKYFCLN
ncbi:unnamed protein product [Menidia menidia]|uniref:(Atlantic silverside) hypothetical protein n=1 Tax=Menidia menidia TaxID=238744 RepID=A0A8S4BDE0_9TELE|nr:unnamed protein product [Menidia menidia]